MIPDIVLLVYRSTLFMGSRKEILNENSVHFIYKEFTFFCTRSEFKYLRNFLKGSYNILLFVLEIECFGTQNFSKITPGWCKNLM